MVNLATKTHEFWIWPVLWAWFCALIPKSAFPSPREAIEVRLTSFRFSAFFEKIVGLLGGVLLEFVRLIENSHNIVGLTGNSPQIVGLTGDLVSSPGAVVSEGAMEFARNWEEGQKSTELQNHVQNPWLQKTARHLPPNT